MMYVCMYAWNIFSALLYSV